MRAIHAVIAGAIASGGLFAAPFIAAGDDDPASRPVAVARSDDPTPTPTPTPTPQEDLTATIGAPLCRASTPVVKVTVTNPNQTGTIGYLINVNGKRAASGTAAPGQNESSVELSNGSNTVNVFQGKNQQIAGQQITANCSKPDPTPTPTPAPSGLTAAIGSVECTGTGGATPTAKVWVTNANDSGSISYVISVNGDQRFTGSALPGTQSTVVDLDNGQNDVRVMQGKKMIASKQLTAQCRRPTPTPTPTPVPPVKRGLVARIGGVQCPGRTVPVYLVNNDQVQRDYSIQVNGSANRAETIYPGQRLRNSVPVQEDVPTTIEVISRDVPVATADVRANCRQKKKKVLPVTGTSAGTYAKGATGVATLLMGGILFWYALQWPRGDRLDWMSKGRRR